MKTAETVFVIPTYRLRDVTETIETYDEHFWSNGHSVKMIVFDDSSLANHEKYFSRLEHRKTTNELYYVGPREKEQFLCFLNKKLWDRKLEALVRNLFRPSYGGNRNFTLMYTLGAFMVSEEILEKVTAVHAKVVKAASTTKNEGGKKTLELFAENLARSFYGFEPDFFQQNVSRIVDDVVSQIHAALEIWPTLIEICYFHKDKREFPRQRIDNKKPKVRVGVGSRGKNPLRSLA